VGVVVGVVAVVVIVVIKLFKNHIIMSLEIILEFLTINMFVVLEQISTYLKNGLYNMQKILNELLHRQGCPAGG
jgi:hypothetical protein